MGACRVASGGPPHAPGRDAGRDVVALFDQLQQLAGGYLALRKDLENLATTADARLQQTRWQLTQLAADTSAENNKQ